ncbi:MAG: response regulator, partial [Lysobacter sp.]|nr:response regulator [Lysobacter sp.]MDV5979854.1 response regulator [Lysobacter sp.]
MPRILLVEDEPAIADTVLYALRADGFEAVHCLTGGEALRLARAEPFDLAVLDVGLPDIGGFALCRELRRDGTLPVIFLTAQGAEADRILGLEIGADDYVTKPFSPREL